MDHDDQVCPWQFLQGSYSPHPGNGRNDQSGNNQFQDTTVFFSSQDVKGLSLTIFACRYQKLYPVPPVTQLTDRIGAENGADEFAEYSPTENYVNRYS